MKTAKGKKEPLIKTWGMHALHHGWTYEEVMAMYSKLLKLKVSEIIAWAKEQRAKGWPRGG